MKKLKKISLVLMSIMFVFVLSGCGREANVEGTLEEIMTKVYEGISNEDKPMMLTNTVVTSENEEYYLGTDKVEFKEGLASESAVGSVAHSIVLLRVDDNADIESIKTTIKDSINPNKWICVGVEKVEVLSKGNLIIVILDDTTGDTIKTNFENLK